MPAWYIDDTIDAPPLEPARLRQHLTTALYDLKHPLSPLPLRPFVLRREVYDDIYRGVAAILPLLRHALFERGDDIRHRAAALGAGVRSEERRVGEEGRSRWS